MNFCTLFDMGYLSRGLALYESLSTHMKSDFRLYVLAMDEECYRFLNRHSLPNLVPVSLSTIEDRYLRQVKPERTWTEYCWTCTSAWINYLIENFRLKAVTYCDADIYFYADPMPAIAQGWDASVMLTPHRYTADYDQSERSGIYCVQFMPFFADKQGIEISRWWKNACINWCYNRHEEGKFGDQKYLDDWPERFSRVKVITDLGVGVAPWNVQQYSFSQKGEGLEGTEIATQKKFNVVFYHHHQFKWLDNDKFDFGQYRIPDEAREYIYKPYVRHLVEIVERFPQLKKYSVNKSQPPFNAIVNAAVRQYRGTHNIYTKGSLCSG